MIREARADDIETLLEIQRRACTVAFAHIFPPERYPFPDDLIRTAWREALADVDVEAYVAEFAGEPIGSVSIGGNFLRTLYVLPAHWRTGAPASAQRCTITRSNG